MNINYIRWLSKHGKVEAERKALKRNWKAVRSVMAMYAREGRYYADYHGFIYEENLERLAAKGFELEEQKTPLGSIYWKIGWEEF